jgi:type II secretory pathway pseudopilin PulG
MRRRAAGFTLVEVATATAILALVCVGVLGSLTLGVKQSRMAADYGLAVDAARRKAEQLFSQPFRQVFALYNEVTSDDPGGVGTGFGPNFAVPGLAPRPDDPDGYPGKIIFPTAAGNLGQLAENVSIPQLGLPRDLNGDGRIDATNVSASYNLLPVIIEVSWRSSYGDGSYRLYLLLADRSGP